MKYKVVITDGRMPNYVHENEILNAVGAEVVLPVIPYGTRDDQRLISLVKDADALIVSQAKITEEIIGSMDHCKIIVRYGIGTDTLDIPAATKHGVMVANVVDHCISEVADTAIALIMCLARKTVLSARQVRKGGYGVAGLKPIHRVSAQTLSLMGCGRIGRDVAKKAQAIGFKVIGYDPYLPSAVAEAAGIQLVDYETALKEADILSLHMPLNEETRDMINRESIEKMKKGACIVNVSRGPLIHEADLAAAIENGWLGGAGLDVTVKEPIEPDNPLLAMDNVIITAHTAWYSDESNEELQIKAAQIVADALTGKEIRTLLNREILNK